MDFQTSLLPRNLELFGNYYGSPVERGFPPHPKLSKCIQGNMEEK